MSEGYTLKEMVSELRDHNKLMDERQVRMEETLNKILDQAIKTNGRVSANETGIRNLSSEHRRVKTVFGTLSAVLSIVWAVLTFVVK